MLPANTVLPMPNLKKLKHQIEIQKTPRAMNINMTNSTTDLTKNPKPTRVYSLNSPFVVCIKVLLLNCAFIDLFIFFGLLAMSFDAGYKFASLLFLHMIATQLSITGILINHAAYFILQMVSSAMMAICILVQLVLEPPISCKFMFSNDNEIQSRKCHQHELIFLLGLAKLLQVTLFSLLIRAIRKHETTVIIIRREHREAKAPKPLDSDDEDMVVFEKTINARNGQANKARGSIA